MTEPVYTFVKGEGWVYINKLFDCRYDSMVDSVGNMVYILDRNPVKGERYVAYYVHEHQWYDKYGLRFEKVKEHLENRVVGVFSPFDGFPIQFRACTLIVEP